MQQTGSRCGLGWCVGWAHGTMYWTGSRSHHRTRQSLVNGYAQCNVWGKCGTGRAKTTEPIELPFGMVRGGLKKSCIRWACTLAPPGKYGWRIVRGSVCHQVGDAACLKILLWSILLMLLTCAGIEMEVIDRCAVDNGGCEHECRHVGTGNDVICSCHAGYRLQANMASCAGYSLPMFRRRSLI